MAFACKLADKVWWLGLVQATTVNLTLDCRQLQRLSLKNEIHETNASGPHPAWPTFHLSGL